MIFQVCEESSETLCIILGRELSQLEPKTRISTKMSYPLSTSLPVGNKDYTNATVVIIGAGISGNLSSDLQEKVKFVNGPRNMHGHRFD